MKSEERERGAAKNGNKNPESDVSESKGREGFKGVVVTKVRCC